MKGTFLATATAIGVASAILAPATSASADKIRNDQWHLRALDVAEAHRISRGEGTTVAVVDTGVEPHQDLRGRLLNGASTIPGESGNGQTDQDGHGTHIAGLIAGVGHGPGSGVLGIAPGTKILPIRIQRPDRNADGPEIGNGIQKAVDQGAKIVNVSFTSGPNREIDRAIQAATDRGAMVVAAIGNANKDIAGGYPALEPGVLAVGGSDKAGNQAEISVNDRAIALCAPANDIVSTGRNGKYTIATGTSDSAAIVSGAAALVWSKFPELSAREVMHRLTATADDNGPPGRDDQCGYGVLNIVKALTAKVPPLPATPPPSTGPTDPTTTTPPAQAAPDQKTRSTNVPAIAGGVAGAVLVGGLGALLVARRRRSAGPDR